MPSSPRKLNAFTTEKEAINERRADIQGLLLTGYNSLRAARVMLLTIVDVALAKPYLLSLANMFVTVVPSDSEGVHGLHPDEAMQMAFTSSGLIQLGLDDDTMDTFSREFLEGMTYPDDRNGSVPGPRSQLLGDTGNNVPRNWIWGGPGNGVHVLLLFYAKNCVALKIFVAKVLPGLPALPGLFVEYNEATYVHRKNDFHEHFGFRDGISTPIIKGLSKSTEPIHDPNHMLEAGEFILGFKNEYGSYSPRPRFPLPPAAAVLDNPADEPFPRAQFDLGMNGSYLVLRQMEQHVERFWKYMLDNSRESGHTPEERAVKLAAKMVGRWPDGQPLVKQPEHPCPMPEALLNKFQFKEEDGEGMRCPFGAHIRRTNPRDQIHIRNSVQDSRDVVKKHRMLRRGRSYGDPVDPRFDLLKMMAEALRNKAPGEQEETPSTLTPDHKITPVRGLFFMALVSDISRQFEFVQNVWANTSTFGNLCNEVDPLIAPRPTNLQPECEEFTTPQPHLRNRYKKVPEFTNVVGGAYFFMPGLAALRYILTNKPGGQNPLSTRQPNGDE